MTEDESVGIGAMEFGEEGVERCLLLFGARVARIAAHVKPSFVADADGMGVVILAVGADSGLWTACLDGAIATDDVVVADALPPSLPVPVVDLGGGGCLAGTHGGAVDDEERDGSHRCVWMHELVPREVAMAVRMLMAIWMIQRAVSFFMVMLICFPRRNSE